MQDLSLETLTPRKRKVLEAAQQLFSEKGFATASMRDLAELLDIKPASLYSHYASKDGILWEIAIRCALDFREAVEPIFLSAQKPEFKLRQMIIAHVEVVIRDIEASAIFLSEWRYLKEPRLSAYTENIAHYEGFFQAVIHEGVVCEVFVVDDEKFSTLSLLSSINWIHRWYRPEGKMAPDEIALSLADFVLGGLKQQCT